MGVADIAEMLGLSRQRADQLTRTRGFPDPVERVAALDRRTVEQMSEQMEVRFAGDVVTFGEALDALDDGAITLPAQPRLWRLEEVERWATANGRMQAADRIAGQARSIRTPVHMVGTINKLVPGMLQELGREPTIEEVAQRVGLPIERVREILRMNKDIVSLEQPVGEEDDFNLSGLIEDRGAVVPDDAATRSLVDAAVREALGHLSEREQDVVRLRFGLDDGKIRTLEEVGREFGVTQERVRQIESKTLAKLRRPDAAHLLRDYLEEDRVCPICGLVWPAGETRCSSCGYELE